MHTKARRCHTAVKTTESSEVLLCGLPQELFDLVLSHLYGYKNDLRSCALVNRSWTAASQKLLFHSVVLHPEDHITVAPVRKTRNSIKQAHNCSRFYNAIESSPHLGQYIRRLEIWEGREYSIETYDLHNEKSFAWIVKEPTLPKVLDLAGRLEYFSLADDYLFPGIEWFRLPSELQMALMRVFAQPTLRLVKMQFNESLPPIEVVRQCRKMYHLRLSLSDVGDWEVEHATYREEEEPPLPLDVLELSITSSDDSTMPIVDWLLKPLCPVDVSGIRKLKLSLIPDMGDIDDAIGQHRQMIRLLERAGSSLEWLGINPLLQFTDTAHHATLDPIRINDLPRLKKLVIETDISCLIDWAIFPLDWVHQFFLRIGPGQDLEDIVVILAIDGDDMVDVKELFEPPGATWSDIGEALQNASLPSLKKLEFVISLFDSDAQSAETVELAERFNSHLMKEMPENLTGRIAVTTLQGGNSLLWKYDMQ